MAFMDQQLSEFVHAMAAGTICPEKKIALHFKHHDNLHAVEVPIRQDLSACELTGSCLWLACDETTTIERLTTKDWTAFKDHKNYDLNDIFDLPSGPDEEIDIEGLAADSGYLWVVGSHSIKRKKPKRHENDPGAALGRLTTVKREANRFFLGRIPLIATEQPDIYDLVASVDGNATTRRTAACVKMRNGRNALIDVLASDPHLAPFLNIPCKENGFDIKGIAARGEQVFLGLRGPVLRGWAMILELRVEDGKLGRLKLRSFHTTRERYRKHFLDLDGLGIRDLVFDRDDLLILAGPTMDLDGPVFIYRWPNAAAATEAHVITHDQLRQVLSLTFGEGVDHAEGATIIRRATKRPALLVVFDSPAPSRLHEDGIIIDADVYRLRRPQNQHSAT